MKDRQRLGLAILLFAIGQLQVIDMLGETLEGPGGVLTAILALLCLGVGAVMVWVRED